MNLNEIQAKEDSLEKLQEVQGRPTKYFIFAGEFNAILTALKNVFNGRQNSLSHDGTGTKYPTVDAVNEALANIETGSGLEIASQAENESAASSSDLNLPNVTNTKASSPRGLRWFWNTVRSINWDWSGRPNFWASIRFGGLTAGHWLRLNANKDVEGFDGQALMDAKSDKADLVITSGTNITTDANWSGRLLKINNGSSNITITVNHAITFAGTKEGTGNIQFVSGSITVTPVDGLLLLSGNIGSTFGVSKRESVSNAVNLFITNR